LAARETAGRRICFFVQVSAPKDVSIAWLVGGDAGVVAGELRQAEDGDPGGESAASVQRGGKQDRWNRTKTGQSLFSSEPSFS
jgi:hypothetical protein